MKFFTGDTPIECLIPERNMLEPIGFFEAQNVWCGCIDAPDYLPAGATFYSTVAEKALIIYTPRPA